MADLRIFHNSEPNVLVLNEKLPCSSDILESLWLPTSAPPFRGSRSMLNFENVSGSETKGSFFQCLEKEEESHDEDYSECFHKPGKKRRLSVDQVQFLEKSFQVENKLEPERKVQLAKEIGLLPRQVAIWFQNRRARYKTKQIEKDYDSLKSSYDKLKSNYDNLLDEKDQLKAVVNGLKGKLLSREKKEELEKPVSSSGNSENVMCKQEDISSTKSDVLDSDSLIENHNSSMVEPAGSSHVFEEQDQLSDNFSHDEEDNLSRTLLPVCFPKLEECYYGDEPPANSCNFGFPFEDQTFCFWSY